MRLRLSKHVSRALKFWLGKVKGGFLSQDSADV